MVALFRLLPKVPGETRHIRADNSIHSHYCNLTIISIRVWHNVLSVVLLLLCSRHDHQTSVISVPNQKNVEVMVPTRPGSTACWRDLLWIPCVADAAIGDLARGGGLNPDLWNLLRIVY